MIAERGAFTEFAPFTMRRSDGDGWSQNGTTSAAFSFTGNGKSYDGGRASAPYSMVRNQLGGGDGWGYGYWRSCNGPSKQRGPE